jgi:putative DNA methylase
MLPHTVQSPVVDPATPPYRKKLIEVALPLASINAASAREKSLRHGHPSTLHLWWARRPLAACRAVLFASLVDDPSSHPEMFPSKALQDTERERLFRLIERLVEWENTTNEHVLAEAKAEIRRSVGEKLPTVYDPFCGGGAIPIESQRLGLPTLASDINPVAVIITKSLTEIPWRFRGIRPVHPSLRGPLNERSWDKASGLAADLDAYGQDVFEAARAKIGSFYPATRLSSGANAPTIAWLWARTVACPNPVCGATIPLVKTFGLCTRPGKEWSAEPVVDRVAKTVRFETRAGKPSRSGTMNRRGAQCLVCGEPVSLAYIRAEGKAKRMEVQMLAIVADTGRGRAYLPANEQHERDAASAAPGWTIDAELVLNPRYMSPPLYGMTKFGDLFTQRQLLAMTTLCDLIRAVHYRIEQDAVAAGMPADLGSLESGASGARAYATAVTTYLALALDRLGDYSSNLCSWHASREVITHVFARQTLSMTWDFVEVNPLSDSSGNFSGALDWVRKCVAAASASAPAAAWIADATAPPPDQTPKLIATDPPYYDNVPYADLSDFFYVWLRSSIGHVYPESMATLLVPKREELVADQARFGSDAQKARTFFEDGLRRAFIGLREQQTSAAPALIFYAFKQTEIDRDEPDRELAGRVSIGWETMLSAVLDAGLSITGTWPMTSELANRQRAQDSNALASSVVLVCRPRAADAPVCGRADFLREVRAELPIAVQRLRDASLAATDLQQSALGPGMAIFSKYRAVLEADDRAMSVRSALKLINDELGQILLGEIADVDAETQFALAWFDNFAYDAGKYGQADDLLRAKNAKAGALKGTGALELDGGIARLRGPRDIGPVPFAVVATAPAWSQLVALIAALVSEEGGEENAADLLRAIGLNNTDRLKSIAYHCYLLCDQKKRVTEARDFNALITAWPEIERRAAEVVPRQESLQ